MLVDKQIQASTSIAAPRENYVHKHINIYIYLSSPKENLTQLHVSYTSEGRNLIKAFGGTVSISEKSQLLLLNIQKIGKMDEVLIAASAVQC